jgi:hypothetical protein
VIAFFKPLVVPSNSPLEFDRFSFFRAISEANQAPPSGDVSSKCRE